MVCSYHEEMAVWSYTVYHFWLKCNLGAWSKCSEASAPLPSLVPLHCVTLNGCYFRLGYVKKPSQRRYYHCSHRKPCGRTGRKTGSEGSQATGCVETSCWFLWWLPHLLWKPRVRGRRLWRLCCRWVKMTDVHRKNWGSWKHTIAASKQHPPSPLMYNFEKHGSWVLSD